MGKEVHLKKHLEATLKPTKSMINKMLEVDSICFDELHYLEPILSTYKSTEPHVKYV
jgi:hypothetical protein